MLVSNNNNIIPVMLINCKKLSYIQGQHDQDRLKKIYFDILTLLSYPINKLIGIFDYYIQYIYLEIPVWGDV